MTNPFFDDIQAQPGALRNLIAFYAQGPGQELLARQLKGAFENIILTGMGASYHAVLTVAPIFHRNGWPALAIESIDLLNYSLQGLSRNSAVVFASQSGASGEVSPILAQTDQLIAVTNDPYSLLAQNAQSVFPVLAGESQSGVACSAYLNMVAALWILARKWTGAWDGTEMAMLQRVAERIEVLIDNTSSALDRWRDLAQDGAMPVFIGHGPHVATARQAAMMLAEWAKQPAIYYGSGAFRHGPIEMSAPGMTMVIFASPGKTQASAINLASELRDIGVTVLLVENGRTRGFQEKPSQWSEIDEFLSPILDIIPVQLFVNDLAKELNILPGFRYIEKVVKSL